MDKDIHKHIKLSPGHYMYRGYQIDCIGYYPPERRVVWEAVDHDGCGFAHSHSLRTSKILIDQLLDTDDKEEHHDNR